jgi:hypothetical protein
MPELLKFKKLLEEFNQTPKIIPQSTYLEICKYPGSRFEEICSRILSFFLKPINEHGLNDLFIRSLLDIIAKERNIRFINRQIQVETEVQTEEGKRLDILILSPDFIIGIENKIYASLYNPLDTYKKLIDTKAKKRIPEENIFKVVLSIKRITDQNELKKIKENNFVKIYYSDFFEKLKNNVGYYITQANQKYLTFMYDFIQTIENMEGKFNNQLFQFFTEHKKSLDEMIRLYNEYNKQILDSQKKRIGEILSKINERTKEEWWAWQGWDLGFNSFNKNTNLPRIGIESSYEFSNQNPLGKFIIYITTWKIKDFEPYENILKEKYPDNFLEKSPDDNRVYLHLEVIENDNENLILEKLELHYKELKEIVNRLSN